MESGSFETIIDGTVKEKAILSEQNSRDWYFRVLEYFPSDSIDYINDTLYVNSESVTGYFVSYNTGNYITVCYSGSLYFFGNKDLQGSLNPQDLLFGQTLYSESFQILECTTSMSGSEFKSNVTELYTNSSSIIFNDPYDNVISGSFEYFNQYSSSLNCELHSNRLYITCSIGSITDGFMVDLNDNLITISVYTATGEMMNWTSSQYLVTNNTQFMKSASLIEKMTVLDNNFIEYIIDPGGE